MSRFLKGTVAALSLIAVSGLPFAAMAQTAPAEAPAAEAPATPTLPQALQALNLGDLQVKEGKRGGQRVEGALPDGTKLKAFVDDQGNLRGAFTEDNKPLPKELADQLIPEAVRSQELLQQFATISGAFGDERGVTVGGTDANGEKLRAGFTADGTLMRFGRGDDMGRGGPEGRRGDHGPGKHGRHGDRGPRGEHGDRGHHGGAKMERPAPLSDEAVTKAVTDAGYTELGAITRDGPRTIVQAKNPQGEAVSVEVTPRGEVVRETAQ